MNLPVRVKPRLCISTLLCLFCIFFPINEGLSQSLGRVFYTPQQRIQLNELQQNQSGSLEINRNSSSSVQDTILYNGIVRRSGGRTTAWINGQRLDQTADRYGDLNLYLRGSNLIVDDRNERTVVGPGEEHRVRQDAMPESTTRAGTDAPSK